jgi:anti-anti-sigma factor
MQELYPDGPEADIQPEGMEEEGAYVVRLAGEFDGYAERMFLGCVRDLLLGGDGAVRFDFSAVQFVDTTGLRCLFQAQRQFRRAGRELVLAGLPEGLQRILRLVSAQGLARAMEEVEASASVSFTSPAV